MISWYSLWCSFILALAEGKTAPCKNNHLTPAIQIGRRPLLRGSLGCINSLSHPLYHCINDIMIFSFIFAIFHFGSGENTLVREQPSIPCHSNSMSTTLPGFSWMYQLPVPSTIPLHQWYHDILFDFRYFWLWQRGKTPVSRDEHEASESRVWLASSAKNETRLAELEHMTCLASPRHESEYPRLVSPRHRVRLCTSRLVESACLTFVTWKSLYLTLKTLFFTLPIINCVCYVENTLSHAKNTVFHVTDHPLCLLH